ncbi:hypothetical protein GM51_8865 [freshwater metagenome]|uniref:Uncharacterized protein n=1 Tax=freshwater metagenome TaxID=449393 RepID=A0A094SIG7_9ZZZZ
MNASIRRNLFIIGAVFVVVGAALALTDFESPSPLDAVGEPLLSLSDTVEIVKYLGVAGGIICLVIAFVSLLRSRSKTKSD